MDVALTLGRVLLRSSSFFSAFLLAVVSPHLLLLPPSPSPSSASPLPRRRSFWALLDLLLSRMEAAVEGNPQKKGPVDVSTVSLLDNQGNLYKAPPPSSTLASLGILHDS